MKESLAVKYRPKTWSQVTEQSSVRTILEQQIASGNICHSLLFIGSAGCGKAQPLYSKLLTPRGYITMGDVRVGDELFTRFGERTRVTAIYPQGVRPIYEMTLQDGTKLRIADNHLNSVYRYNQSKKCREDFVLSTLDLVDFLKTSKWKLRVDVPSVDWEHTDVLINPYLLGALLGDGSLASGNLGFSNAESDVVRGVDAILQSDYGMQLRHICKYDYRICYIERSGHNGSKGDRGLHELVRNYDVLSTLRGQLSHYGLLCKSTEKHIPTEYLHNDKQTRLALLQGLFDTDGCIGKNGGVAFTTSSKQLSDDFAFLVRSLGIRDTVKVSESGYKDKQGNTVTCSLSYTHYLHVPNDMVFYTSMKHASRRTIRQNEPLRNIVSVKYVGDEICQCIMVDNYDHTYISDDFIPTHNTTCARIFANEVNRGKGTPIELDAASNNGVDDVRRIIEQAQTKSLDSEYKVFIIDECVTGDTELLTEKGFVRFDELGGNELVAQYNNGNVEFVRPIRFIKQHYADELVKWNPRNWCSVRMTKHHVQPLYYIKSDSIREKYIQDVKFNQQNNLIVSGKGVGANNSFSPIDRLVIACQADGTLQNTNSTGTRWVIQIKKQRKIDRLLKLFEEGHVNFSEIKSSRPDDVAVRRFGFDMPKNVSKRFSTYFSLVDMGACRAKSFIEELQYWDGSTGDNYIYYGSTVKENTDFVSAVAPLAGYSARQTVKPDNRSENYSDVYAVRLYETSYSNCQYIGKTVEYELYDGDVYCVEVPSHQIIIRAGGFVFMTGNCHSLSSQGWQAFLKLIEEPPAKSIFIFCTTEINKIPKTIISRVQKYQFKKISQKGIVDRLRYVLQQEDAGTETIYPNARATVSQIHLSEALEFIARISEGGMRDALTLLDKCLSYSHEITLRNVVEVLGTVDYDTMMKLTDAYLELDRKQVVEILSYISDDGKDMKQFLKSYTHFLMDILKYMQGCGWAYLTMPNLPEYEDYLNDVASDKDNYALCLDLMTECVKLSSNIKYSATPKLDIEAMFLIEMGDN